ncbi:hypothetical protein BJ508DRAFT_415597 [Ascobolus immersus RN42]|uniref:Methyltransferase n=1 Tax=Ascobolus immersus RN42 TaxID=1160509 RepID=A0A3N4I1R2_ASCIM|nr:hypothetical protein BJ508DRAFT_415597 [Ascobolus immersus RN42]
MPTKADLWFIKELDVDSDPVTTEEPEPHQRPGTCLLGASAESIGQLHSYALDNFNYDIKTVEIEDIRGRQNEFSLGVQGFTYQPWADAPELDWQKQEDIEKIFLPAAKKYANRILREQGVGPIKLIHVCHWRMRTTAPPELTTAPAPLHQQIMRDKMAKIRPSTKVHVDWSADGVMDQLYATFGWEVADRFIGKYRVQIVNVWKPLVDVVHDYPLACVDTRTVKQTDLFPLDILTPGSPTILKRRRGYVVKYSPRYRFYYLDKMTKNEVCMMKIFDSSMDIGGCSPHVAFKQENPESSLRESIEVRLAVFSEY